MVVEIESYNSLSADQIDAELPQTQCRKCGYDSCYEYAFAIKSGIEQSNRCVPGGLPVLTKLNKLTSQDHKSIAHEIRQSKLPTKVVIDENKCIGCTLCIPACPVDAIIGSGKLMHTVMKTECNGCGLCVTACPVDCIYPNAEESVDKEPSTNNKHLADRYRHRFYTKNIRHTEESQTTYLPPPMSVRTAEILESVLRSRRKKLASKRLGK